MDSDDDIAARHWLRFVRNGTPKQKALARTELGLIFERRGLLEDAVRAYEANVNDSVLDPRPLERLAAIHARRGDSVREAALLVRTDRARPRKGTSPASARPQRRLLDFVALASIVNAVLVGALMWVVLLYAPSEAQARARLAWCSDPIARFPEWADPDGVVAVLAHDEIRARGGNPFSRGNPFVRDLMLGYTSAPFETVATWIAHTLYLNHQGQGDLARTIREHLEYQYEHRVAMPSLLGWDHIRPVLSAEQWAKMRAWSVDDCDGVLMGSLHNARLVRLMALGVGTKEGGLKEP